MPVSTSTSGTQIKRYLLLWFGCITALLILSTISVANLFLQNEREYFAMEKRKDVISLLEEAVFDEAAGMDRAVAALKGRQDLIYAFETRDRELLLKLSQPLFDYYRNEHQITHFYFSDRDRVNFLRVHAPSRHGDTIDRHTTLEAERTGRPSQGLELGVLGTFTLRAVSPWHVNGELIGFIELGMEISHVLARIESATDVIVAQAIKRELVDSSKRGSMLPDVAASDVLDDHLLITQNGQELPQALISSFNLAIGDDADTSRTIDIEGATFSIATTELLDVAGKSVGRFLIAQDITIARKRDQKTLLYIIFTMVGLSAAGSILFVRTTSRAQHAIDKQQTKMEAEIDFQRSNLFNATEQFERAQRIAKIGVWELDLTKNELTWSDETYRIFDVDPETFQPSYESFLSAVHPDDREMVDDAYKRSLETKRPHSIVHRLLTSDGSIKFVQENCETEFGLDGRALVSRGTVLDVTEVKRLEADQSASQQLFQAVFENNTEGLIVADTYGRMMEFNHAAENIFGYSAQEVIGKNLSILMPESDCSNHDQFMKSYIDGGRPKIIGTGREVTALHRNGSTFPIRLGISELTEGSERLFVGVITDLTKVNSLETQLRRSQKMEAIGELTGGIAHDFNNLLGIIVGNLDLLKRDVSNDEKVLKRVLKAQGAAVRGGDLTRRLLNFSRQSIEASSPIDINPVIKDIENLIGKSLTSRVSLELDLADNLWLAEVDPSAFEDVLINLAINARDAMPDGGRLIIETRNAVFDNMVAVDTDNMSAGEYVEIAITDNGSGIPRSIQDSIFDPFFTTKDKGKGTGLGLAMVYGFLKRSRGHITVYSEEGVGTTFKLYLPRSNEQASGESNERKPDEDMPHGTETILIVDDEEGLLDIAESVLKGLGYITHRAENGDAALALLESGIEIDLLFSDVVMPGSLDGFALAKDAIMLRPNIKVLLASGFTGKIIRTGESSQWAENLLNKPYRDVELARRVRQVLDGTSKQ